ncbi:unnamed protein product [Caenorhabditis bovis]|uniref:Ig-like domain-containing protein n=1 Tax=Caenorhabditis bovis TaxID=2654633 RepID=A0A8S1ERP3_9PELO|nr:unnamed protein product [Caenorhabditis bovis]
MFKLPILVFLAFLHFLSAVDVEVVINPAATSLQKPSGHQLSLVCSVKGDFNERPGLMWKKHGGLEKTGHVTVQRLDDRTMSLLIRNSSSDDSGVYICQVQVDGKTAAKKIDVVFFEDLKFVENETHFGEILATASVNLSCEVTAKNHHLSTLWTRHGKQISEGGKYKFYKNRAIFELKDYQPDQDAGQYTCEVTDSVGTTANRKFSLGTHSQEKTVFCQKMCTDVCSSMYDNMKRNAF